MKYPKVLIISPYFLDDVSNETSITMKSYFEEWPEENIAQIITGQFNVSKKDNTQSNFFILNNSDIRILRHLFDVERSPKSDNIEKQYSSIKKQQTFKQKTKSSIKRALSSTTDFFKYSISNDLKLFIRKFDPDVIYYLPNGYRSMRLVNDISRKFQIKQVLHFMDDWPSTKYDFTSTRLHEYFMSYYIKKSISNASACLCISEYMSREYEKRYNIDKCYSLMNSVDRYYGNDTQTTDKKDKPIRITYLGGLNNQRANIIKQLYKTLEKSHFPTFELVIHTSETMWEETKHIYSNCVTIKYGGYLTRNEVFAYLLNSDILLHVESFDKRMRKYTKYSMSSKIPEYLSTGKIILGVGPSEVASIKYLSENNMAITITDLNDNKQLSKKINKLSDTEYKTHILENAKDIFRKNHLKENQVLLPLLKEITNT